MKFGCNYSKELLELLNDDLDFCDYIKIGAFGDTLVQLEQAFSYKPLLIHGFGWHERGGMNDLDIMDFEKMNRMLKLYKTPCLGMHAMAFEKDMEEIDDLLIHMTKVFTEISRQLSTELIIENMDYSPFYEYPTTVSQSVVPEFLAKLSEKTNLNLLLDLSHALVSSYQLGIDIYEYIERLPLEKVREIHVSGSFYDKTIGYKDIHGVLNESDYKIIEFIADHPKIKKSKILQYITLEYGTIKEAEKKEILQQMEQLKEIFN